MIANLFNIPNDQKSWDEYSFALQGVIRDVNRRIYETDNVALPEYLLDPLNLTDPSAQLYGLQTSMNNINAVLGISGYNYLDVSFQEPGETASWTWLLATNLREASKIVGVA